ncbi:phosphotransferase [Pseudactinotalea sp. Z1748]|uniref:phosphotransferase n=1 Tax=Pseudactinotalea sp. Z1748 TaxID=3413027 RepID=UPI003C7A54EB
MSTSPRSPLALAALATVAIPGLDVVAARPPHHTGAGFDVASLMDAQGRRWTVRAPRSTVAGAALEGEVDLLAVLAEAVDNELLPFEVPRPAGFAALPEGGRAMVYRELRGRPLQVQAVSAALARRLGQTLARIHDLDTVVVADAGLPVYDAESYRRRRLAELDEAARTGHVPTDLLRRWERALEDVRLWKFIATPVHGDLAGEHILVDDDEVTVILDWADARVADPADDLAWLIAAAAPETGDAILAAYTQARGDRTDEFLAARTLLASELALPRWLMHGVRTRDNSVIDDAIDMLTDLDRAVAHADPIGQVPVASTDWVTGPVPLRTDGAGAGDDLEGGTDSTGGELDDTPDAAESAGAGAEAGADDPRFAAHAHAEDMDYGTAGIDEPTIEGGIPVRNDDGGHHRSSRGYGTGVLAEAPETADVTAPDPIEPDYDRTDPDRGGDDAPTGRFPSR